MKIPDWLGITIGCVVLSTLSLIMAEGEPYPTFREYLVKWEHTQNMDKALYIQKTLEAEEVCHRFIPSFDDLPYPTQEALMAIEWDMGDVKFTRMSDLFTALHYNMGEIAIYTLAENKWFHTISKDRQDDIISRFRLIHH